MVKVELLNFPLASVGKVPAASSTLSSVNLISTFSLLAKPTPDTVKVSPILPDCPAAMVSLGIMEIV